MHLLGGFQTKGSGQGLAIPTQLLTFPEDRAPLPPVEVDQHREEGDGRGVIPPGLHIDLTNEERVLG